MGLDGDPFDPEFVTWWYGAEAIHAVRAALALPGPASNEAPKVLMAAPDHSRKIAQRFGRNRVIRPPMQRPNS